MARQDRDAAKIFSLHFVMLVHLGLLTLHLHRLRWQIPHTISSPAVYVNHEVTALITSCNHCNRKRGREGGARRAIDAASSAHTAAQQVNRDS
jgi:hypothetical protein